MKEVKQQIKNIPGMFNAKGFTLLELLVVVLIIGILAAVALPQYKKSVEKARMTEAITMVEKIAEAQQRHYLLQGTYTRNINDLDIDIPGEDVNYYSVKGKSGKHFIFAASNSDGSGNTIAIGNKIPIFDKYSLAIIGTTLKKQCVIYNNITSYEKKLCQNWANGSN